MSGQSEEADFDEIDLKDLLLKTLRENGTLKCIQGQLTAAIYAAFYEQKNNTSVPTPSSVSTFLSTLNGLTAVSLVVDLFETLKLKHSLQVFVDEANLASVHLKSRRNLFADLEPPSSFPDSMPLLLSLIPTVSAEKKKLVGQPEADRMAGSGDKISIKESDFLSKAPSVSKPMDLIDKHQSIANGIPTTPAPDTDLQPQSAYTDSAESKLQPNNALDRQFCPSTNKHDTALLRKSSPTETQLSSTRSDVQELKNEPESGQAEKSEITDGSRILASSPQPKQPSVSNDVENKYSDESFTTESDNSIQQSKAWLDEALDDAAPSADENELSESIHRLELVSPDNSSKQERTLTSSADANINSRLSQKKSADHHSDQLFKATPGKSLDHREPVIQASLDGDSDIDSEATDFTVNSSHTEGCDYVEPVQSLI